jgi:spore germination protein D
MIRLFKAMAVVLLLGLIAACGSDQGGNGGGMISYKEMKSMVIDILKTEEAQMAIHEASTMMHTKAGGDAKILQMLSTPEGQQIRIAVKEVLTDPSYPHILKTMMTDPKFAGEFAKAVQKENKEIHKELMTDPEYQTLLLDTLKNPEFESIVLDIMKGKAYRQYMMTVIKETMQNPIFKMELLELMTKALEEQSQPKGGERESARSGQEGGGGQGGEGGGGNSSQGGSGA